MTRYCESKSSAIINITWSEGKKERVASDSPYVDVTSSSQSSYVLHYYYHPIGISGEGQFTRNIGVYSAPLTLGSIVYSNPSSSGFGGYLWSDVNYVDGSGNSGTIPVSHNNVYGHTVTDVYVTNDGIVTKVSVVDKNAKVIQITGNGTATWTVTCDDECPPGYMKCECNSYPGYCCISCSEIRSGINNATALLRGING